jgi:hypothetical protein
MRPDTNRFEEGKTVGFQFKSDPLKSNRGVVSFATHSFVNDSTRLDLFLYVAKNPEIYRMSIHLSIPKWVQLVCPYSRHRNGRLRTIQMERI